MLSLSITSYVILTSENNIGHIWSKEMKKMSTFGSTPRNLNVCIYTYLLGLSIINCHFNLRGNERSPEAKKKDQA